MKRHINSYKPLALSFMFSFSLWLLITFLSRWENFTSRIYPDFYAWFYPKFTNLWGWVPFSVGDLMYAVFGVIFIIIIVLIVRCFSLGQKWRGIRVISRLINSLAILYFLFHILWGFNYYKPNLTEKLQGNEYSVEELKFIAEDSFRNSFSLRENLQEDNKGVIYFKRNVFYPKLPNHLKLTNTTIDYDWVPRKSQKKYSMYSYFMRYFGVGGYYNPFTAEAQVTRLSPPSNLPNNMAHEQAHQMGFATEYEANFIGYLTNLQSDEDVLQYAANFKALKYVLNELYSQDSVYVRQTLDSFSPGMTRDYQAEREFYQKYSGRADRIFSSMNNAYLKANRQEEGIQSYNRFVELLVGYYRTEKDMNLLDKRD